MRLLRLIGLAAVAAALVAAVPAVGGASSQPQRIAFHKCGGSGGVWTGMVDLNGDGTDDAPLTTVLKSAAITGEVMHVNFDWIIGGPNGFTANLDGILKLSSLDVVMNGAVVTAGPLQGAQVHETGAFTGFDGGGGLCFAGTIQVQAA
jgi:hypothetical protein